MHAPSPHRPPEPGPDNHYLEAHAQLLVQGYHRLTGRDLIAPALSPREQARALFEAPFVVASHGTEPDPIFNYANRAALALWETDWAAFTAMPSRHSAEAVERGERERLLAQVTRRGFIDDYSGIRISATGRRFRIRRATVWNILDVAGVYRGQAVVFREWDYL